MEKEYLTKRIKNSLIKKLSFSFFALCIIVGAIYTVAEYIINKQYVFNLYSNIVTSCSADVANMLYDAPLESFINGEEIILYRSYLRSIRNKANIFGLKYLYVYIPNIEDKSLVSVFAVEGKTRNIVPDFELGNTPKNLQVKDEVLDMFKNKTEKLVVEGNNKYGHVFSGYSLVFDKRGVPIAIVGADVDFSDIYMKLFRDIVKIVVFIIAILCLFYVLVFLYIKKIIIKPILTISTEMKNFVSKNKLQYKPISLNTNDEFEIVADSYNIMSENIKNLMKTLFDAQVVTIFSFAKLAQTRDEGTGKHIERVQLYCRALLIGVMLNKIYPNIVNRTFIRNVFHASPLHDIGKVAIADRLLNSTNKLTPEEKEEMQKHTIYGEQTLSKINEKYGHNDLIDIGRLIAKYHHEKWDGTGYMEGLKGEEIPLEARIVAIADVYDALSTKRTYKEAFEHSKCVQMIVEEKGKSFDPQLVDVFVKIEQKFLKIRESFEEE